MTMQANAIITDLRGQIDQVRKDGQNVISVEGLDRYLVYLSGRVDATNTSKAEGAADADAKRAFQEWQTRLPLIHADMLENFRTVIAAGQSALKAAQLINGGAAVALLAFVGNAVSRSPPQVSIQLLARAMLCFVFGVGLSTVGEAGRYFTQRKYQDHTVASVTGDSTSASRHKRNGDALNAVTIAFGVASLVAFFVGGLMAYNAL